MQMVKSLTTIIHSVIGTLNMTWVINLKAITHSSSEPSMELQNHKSQLARLSSTQSHRRFGSMVRLTVPRLTMESCISKVVLPMHILEFSVVISNAFGSRSKGLRITTIYSISQEVQLGLQIGPLGTYLLEHTASRSGPVIPHSVSTVRTNAHP